MSIEIIEGRMLLLCQLTNVTTKVDHTLKLTLVTQEVKDKEHAGFLVGLNQQMIALSIRPGDDIVRQDLIDLEKFEPEVPVSKQKEQKSPSKKLRDKLFVKWDKLGKPTEDFEVFYASRIDEYLRHEQKLIDEIVL